MKQIDIREIQTDELNELLKLYQYLHEKDEPLPETDIVEDTWDQISSNPNLKYFGVFKSGKLISSCTISIIPNLTRACRPYGLIENVVTHPDQRKKGYGKEILERAIEFAWVNNCYKVMLMTGRMTEKTFRFYEATGFNRHSKQAFILKN